MDSVLENLQPPGTGLFRQDGIVTFRGLVPPDAVVALRQLIIEHFDSAFAAYDLQVASVAGDDYGNQSLRLRRMFEADPVHFWSTSGIAQMLTDILAFGNELPLRRALSRLGIHRPAYAYRPDLVWAANWLEEAGAYSRRPLHQDWERIQGSLDSMVLWLPLCEVRDDNFPIEVWPGSHRLGALDHEPYKQGIRLVDTRFDPDAPSTTITAQLGDVVVMSSLLAHRSGQGIGDVLRMALSYRYNNAAEPSFIARGFPRAVRTVVHNGRLNGDFPDEQQASSFFARSRRGESP